MIGKVCTLGSSLSDLARWEIYSAVRDIYSAVRDIYSTVRDIYSTVRETQCKNGPPLQGGRP
ncbi:MAG: hypothetical protein IJK39_05735 [Bacteroidales bacterium]|nr:hypothetical protein [Bacteroidales bacterium]